MLREPQKPCFDVWVRPQLEGPPGAPFFFRCDLKKFIRGIAVLFAVFVCLGLSTLLFFRELEKNRHLENRVLELELQGTLQRATAVTSPASVLAPVESVPLPAVPKLGDIGIECDSESCDVQLSLVSSGTGPVKGKMSLVLETHLVRIGGTSENTGPSRYLVSPGDQFLEELSTKSIETLPKRSFRFSRALQSNVTFNFGSQGVPVLFHLYLFDEKGVLLSHEQKPVEVSK